MLWHAANPVSEFPVAKKALTTSSKQVKIGPTYLFALTNPLASSEPQRIEQKEF